MVFYAGDILYASDLNSILNPPACVVSRVATQSVTTGSSPTITFDTEIFDNVGMFTASSDTITVPTGADGVYDIACKVDFQSNATGFRIAQIEINAGDGTRTSFQAAPGGVSSTASCAISRPLAAGDALVLRVSQNSGSTLTVTAVFSITRSSGS